MDSSDKIVDFAAGITLGGLTGLLVGLTTTSVTATILSSIVAIATAFIGLAGEPKLIAGTVTQLRIIGFAAAMIAALLAGIWMRTHNVLSPTPKQIFDQLLQAGLTKEQATQLVVFSRFGLMPEGATPASETAVADAAKRDNTTLFFRAPAWCDDFLQRRTQPANDQIAWLAQQGGEYEEMAARLNRLPEDRKPAVLKAAPFYICGVS